MTVNNQIELKKRANRDAGIKKSWRELEDKINTHSPRDFRLRDNGWQSTKEPSWQED